MLVSVKLEWMISQEEVKHIAKLARLNLSDDEVKKFSGQLQGILEYIDVLNEVDTEGIEETSQVTGLTNVTEEDKVTRKCEGDELLLSSPLPKERKQIRTKPAITK